MRRGREDARRAGEGRVTPFAEGVVWPLSCPVCGVWGVAPLPPPGGVACLGVFWVLFFVLEPFLGWFGFGSGPVLKLFCTGSGRGVSQVVCVAESI